MSIALSIVVTINSDEYVNKIRYTSDDNDTLGDGFREWLESNASTYMDELDEEGVALERRLFDELVKRSTIVSGVGLVAFNDGTTYFITKDD